MSKTFKTNPSWVKVRQNPSIAAEYHNHENGICNIDEIPFDRPFYWENRYSCGYNVKYYAYNGGFYSRPKRGQSYKRRHEGRFRTQWNNARNDLKKLDAEGREDYDVNSYQHRHSGLWDMW